MNGYVLNLTMQNLDDGLVTSLKMSPKNLKVRKWTEPLLKRRGWGGGAKVRPSMLGFGQCAVAILHKLQHIEEREKN